MSSQPFVTLLEMGRGERAAAVVVHHTAVLELGLVPGVATVHRAAVSQDTAVQLFFPLFRRPWGKCHKAGFAKAKGASERCRPAGHESECASITR